MAKALLLVESKPASPEQVDDYHAWHESTHIPEMLSVGGFVSARRWQADDGESFVTLYEIDTDVDTARANLSRPASWPDIQTRCGAVAAAARPAVPDVRR